MQGMYGTDESWQKADGWTCLQILHTYSKEVLVQYHRVGDGMRVCVYACMRAQLRQPLSLVKIIAGQADVCDTANDHRSILE